MIETLENRIAPANLTVTFAGGTLKIVGDAAGNDVSVDGIAGQPTTFELTSLSDTFNGAPGPFTTPDGVKNIVFKGGKGQDSIQFTDTVPIQLAGSVKIFGGAGAQYAGLEAVTIGKNLIVKNGNAGADQHIFFLRDSNVGGNVIVQNAGGDSSVQIARLTEGHSAILGNVKITNGIGKSETSISDTHVGGNVTALNGGVANDSDDAGFFTINNAYNTASRSIIGGNVKVVWSNGMINLDGIADTEVHGNVSFTYGPGRALVLFDGYRVNAPVVIHGNLMVQAAEALKLAIADRGYFNTGLKVGGNVKIAGGNGNDLIGIFGLTVAGKTSIKLGAGIDEIVLNDSSFLGEFTADLGGDANFVSIEEAPGSVTATLFFGPAVFRFGPGDDSVVFAGGDDAEQQIVSWSTFRVIQGGGGFNFVVAPSQILFPLGGEIEGL